MHHYLDLEASANILLIINWYLTYNICLIKSKEMDAATVITACCYNAIGSGKTYLLRWKKLRDRYISPCLSSHCTSHWFPEISNVHPGQYLDRTPLRKTWSAEGSEARNSAEIASPFSEGKCDVTSPLKCSIPEGILPSFPLQRAIHSSCWLWESLGFPVQADSTVGNQAPALKIAEVSKCSIALHFMPGRNIPLRQAKDHESLPSADNFFASEVPRANYLLVYSLTSLLRQDYWPKWQKIALETLWLLLSQSYSWHSKMQANGKWLNASRHPYLWLYLVWHNRSWRYSSALVQNFGHWEHKHAPIYG